MPQIGQFERTPEGFTGRIVTLLVQRQIVIIAAESSEAENAPDYRVHVHDDAAADIGPEVGAGWKRTGERAGDYIALLFDDPVLAQPIRANLFRDDGDGAAWSLHWNRAPRREPRD